MTTRMCRSDRSVAFLLTCLLVLNCGLAAWGQERQDGRYIPRLEWTSPHGERPGTYAEYLRAHPLQPACLSDGQTFSPQEGGPGPREPLAVSLLVDAVLYPSITTGLDQYVADLASEGYSVFVQTVSGGTPADIKAWVSGRYAAGDSGVVFIGDITAAWAEVAGDVFPSDLYYMDLDGNWQDADSDGDFEIHTAGAGDEGPEVFVARINAHTLNYAGEASMVNSYFAKAHAYRTGALDQPWRGLEYVEEDWYDMEVYLNNVYGEEVTRYDYGYFTTAADYLNQMDLGQHFVQVCAHSYSGGHHFGTRPTEAAAYAHVYVNSPSTRAARIWVGCDDGAKVWFNGSNVLTRDVYQDWTADQYSADVTLSAGWNRLLCKISQGGGTYQFSARLTNTSNATFSDLQYQLSDPDTHGEEGQFIRGWLLNGFHQDISDNFWSYLTTNYLGASESSVNPSAGEIMGGKTWTTCSSTGPYVDMDAYGGGADFGASYAFVRVNADSSKSCQLWTGYADGARIWLNGAVVLYDNRYGDYVGDMTKTSVNLVAGTNRLLVKVSEWMGATGFSARFCNADGTPVSGLTYDPSPDPVSYIGTWLLNGPYANPNQTTRLSQDYLGGEAGVRPSPGDAAPFGTWQQGLGSGYPFDVGVFYDRGDWVFSEDIQGRDPPVLFYNLFACGPGRFTDSNYLAGAYIFNTTYGLITIASAKSGSMLNFQDFTAPLGEGQTIGTSFRQWFDAQSPYEQWEREWYYGMVLNGDPLLRPIRRGDLNRDGTVDAADVPLFISVLLGQGADPGHVYRSDMNNDGVVNGKDIQFFVDELLG